MPPLAPVTRTTAPLSEGMGLFLCGSGLAECCARPGVIGGGPDLAGRRAVSSGVEVALRTVQALRSGTPSLSV